MYKKMFYIYIIILIVTCIVFYRNTSYIERFTGKRPLVIGFDTTWGGFNSEHNMFILILQHYTKRDVIGVDISKFKEGEEKIDICMFLFGEGSDRIKKLKVPVIQFSGEAHTKVAPLAQLSLGFDHNRSEKYLRFPLWLIYINWFNTDPAKTGNPSLIPLERCLTTYREELPKKKFCIFIVSNSGQKARNDAFDWLSTYKKVDSAGQYKNNMGDVLPKGSGGFEIAKFNLLKDYKFSLTYENVVQNGYTTEKILHAKAAGCIPIYWGDPLVEEDFDINGCINARGIRTHDELIRVVRNVDTNDHIYRTKYMTPLLDKTRLEKAYASMKEFTTRVLKLVKFD
jgi:hypothetical protein